MSATNGSGTETRGPRPTTPLLAVHKPLADLTPADEALVLGRSRPTDESVERAVASIIADVRARGDAALFEMAKRFDGVTLDAVEVPSTALTRALDDLDSAVRQALDNAAAAIGAFHHAQLPAPLEMETRPGIRLGRRTEPLRRVGVYAPGGRAAYPSSVLMGVVPARVAGVSEVVVCSPPGPDGLPPAAVLAACALAGADRVFSLGGAGAVTALAYGTTSVPRVDKVVGPGNAYVTEAKRQLAGAVASDCPAGPSEILIIADGSADPDLVAAELLAQAEHDPEAAAVLVATEPQLLPAVDAALRTALEVEPRRAIIRDALATRGALLLAAGLDEALAFAERYAPEHLLLLVRKPRAALDRVRAAGTVFLGAGSSVAFGDYLTGANHVLPTGGLGRAYSGLSVLDFLRSYTYQEVGDDAAAELAGPTATLAEAEGLPAHARAARLRAREGRAVAEVRRTSPPPPSPILGREAYREIKLYDPGREACEVDLSDNTNRFGVSPAAARALAALDADAITRYPSVYAGELKAALAERHGVAPENIVTGCGSDDVIDSAVRAFCEPGDVVAFPDPTFSMVPIFARMNAAMPAAVPLGADFSLDPDALIAAAGTVTYLSRPNNPTGTAFEREAVVALADGAAGVVLVDEAYADFADDDVARLAASSARLVALRTFSKAYGLAGLRVGYAIGPPHLIAEIEKSRGPYKVTTAAEAAASAALREDSDWVRGIVEEIRANRARLTERLVRLGLRSWPSSANFLLVRSPPRAEAPGEPDGDAIAFAAALRQRGIGVRAFPGLPHAGDCVRVTVGPWPLLERFLAAASEILHSTDSAAPAGSGAGGGR